MSNWNDDRLDKFERRVDERFDKVDKRFDRVDERFERVAERFSRVDKRLADTPTRKEMNDGFAELRQGIDKAQAMVIGLNRTLIAGAIGIIIALIGFHG